MSSALIFPLLTPYSYFTFILAQKLAKKDIYYTEISREFKDTKAVVERLEKNNIKWIKKYYKSNYEHQKYYFIADSFTEIIYNRFFESQFFKILNKDFLNDAVLMKKAEVMWKKIIYEYLENLSQQYAAAEYLTENGHYDNAIIITYEIAANMLKPHANHKIIFNVIPLSYFVLKDLSSILKLLFRMNKKGAITNNKSLETTEGKPLDFPAYKVAFFPHQGIYYGNLFVKDQFYSDDESSELHKSKILHVSINEINEDYIGRALQYYRDFKIPVVDLVEIGYSNKKCYLQSMMFLMQKPFSLIRETFRWGLELIFLFVLTFFRVQCFLSVLSRFKNLKLVMVGYDFLFPPALSLALALLRIHVCAVQERFIMAFMPNTRFVVDCYFAAGPVVKEKGCKHSYIGDFIYTGLPRADNLFLYEKEHISDSKYDEIKKKYRLVLALDYFLPRDDVEDISFPHQKVSQMRQFYNDLIKLSVEFPDLYIVIKGKEIESYKSHYIADIVEKIEGLPNMEIETDLDKYNPYYIGEKADLTIACHTSLCDELLAAGRKVIFYEATDYMETYFTYEDLPIIVKDYEVLRNNVKYFIEGVYLDSKRIERLKAYYSNCYHGKVKETIRRHIINFLEKKDRNKDC
ncbi:MAG: hypothetical protein RDV48_06905 [Candidatus Eremiobacteraeota bacterium]|nr:hypothetical protein [Candidatus Eremiobacteraeota bacterium]